VSWRQDPGNPVIAGPPPELDVVGFRDHAVWREDGSWCQLIGCGIRDIGGAVLRYGSDDLRHWTYTGPLLVADGPQPETMWECPDFFALGDRHALVVSAWHGWPLDYALCFTGGYAGGRFEPSARSRVDHGSRFYAPQSLRDDRGRRIQFGWLVEGRPAAAQLAAGWSGVMSLPRELGIDAAGRLTVRPVDELRGGRGRRLDAELRGRAVEIVATLPARGRAGVAVLGAPDGSEQTPIVYDGDRGSIAVGGRAVPLDTAGAPIRLHVFVDHSVVEVFVDDRIAISERAYPAGPESDRIRVIGAPSQLEVWERPSIWDGLTPAAAAPPRSARA
jgi:beta-fructofuranosidase